MRSALKIDSLELKKFVKGYCRDNGIEDFLVSAWGLPVTQRYIRVRNFRGRLILNSASQEWYRERGVPILKGWNAVVTYFTHQVWTTESDNEYS